MKWLNTKDEMYSKKDALADDLKCAKNNGQCVISDARIENQFATIKDKFVALDGCMIINSDIVLNELAIVDSCILRESSIRRHKFVCGYYQPVSYNENI